MPQKLPSGKHEERDGVSAIFRTRADADMAIEHLAQEYGIDSSFIYVEAAEDENSAGVDASGGDHASAYPSHENRADAPLHGAIRLTVLFEHEHLDQVENALRECGGLDVEDWHQAPVLFPPAESDGREGGVG